MPSCVTINYFSLATIRFTARKGNIEFPATGFIVKRNREYFLVSALHVFSGRHWQSKRLISKTGFIPEEFELRLPFFNTLSPGKHQFIWIKLIAKPDGGDEAVSPWLVHPVHKEEVDVGVMPLGDALDRLLQQQIKEGNAEPGSQIFAIELNAPSILNTRIADDVFVVGFPENIDIGVDLPVWKRGNVASEPDLLIKGLPYILVDTGTRSGMSGGSVIRRASAGTLMHDAVGGISFIKEPVYELFGIYAARFGADDLTSQLGIVWHRSVLDDIFASPMLARSSLCTWLWP